MFELSEDSQKQINLLVTPSWVSGMVAVLVGLALTVGSILIFSATTGGVEQQLLNWQQTQQSSAPTVDSEDLNNKPTLEDTWPLLIVWSLVGVVVYLVTLVIVHSLSNVRDLGESLEYVHSKPVAVLSHILGHFLVRSVAFVIFLSLGYMFIKYIVPYSITAAHASTAYFPELYGLVYSLLAFAVIIVCLHLMVVFLRLSLGRPRVFLNSIGA